MRMFCAALLSLGLFVSGAADAAPLEKCDNCETFRKGVSRKVIPTDNVVCIYFVQPTKGDVLLRIDLKDGGVRPYTKKAAGTADRICVGRHWIDSASTMLICNDANHALYKPEHVAIVAAKSKLSRTAEACLFGTAKCREMGYQTRP